MYSSFESVFLCCSFFTYNIVCLFVCLFVCGRSVCLLLQVALPCLLFAPEPSRLVLRGGTNADMAPPIDYTMRVQCCDSIII